MIGALPIGWRGQAMALSLLLLMLGLVYVLLAVPLQDLYADRAVRLETRQALLLKLNAVAAEIPALHAQAASLRDAASSGKVILDGASDTIASATLQGRIEALASASGVTIGSTENLAPQAQGHYRRIGLRLVVSTPYAGLVKLLGAIEGERPPLIVDELQVHSFQRRAGAAPAETLDASLQVYGFRADEAEIAAKP